MSSEKELQIILEESNQRHLLRFWNDLTEEEKLLLEKDIKEINFKEANQSFWQVKENEKNKENLDIKVLKPVPSEIHGSLRRTSKETLEQYRERGLKEISEGNVGVILLAGGQGTRLGVSYPKGMYNINLPSKKSLFQIQAERIRRLQSIAKEHYNKTCNITWYIMTSDATKESTEKFFEDKCYFGLDKKNVVMFEQGRLPCFDVQGKVLLDQKYRVSTSPNGNGGLYKALRDEKILQDMNNRHIKYLHTYCVDNVLVRVADPVFIGYCISKGADCAAKVVEKISPEEAVGVVCDADGIYQVVEYSEIPPDTSNKTDSKGRLIFNAGNICNHFFTTAFLENVCNNLEKQLKFHKAEKKIPYVNENGVRIEPKEISGIKLEKFVFDVFQFAENFIIWEVLREEEFSALKNGLASQKDNAKTAVQDVDKLHRRFVKEVGGKVIGNEIFEISPLLSYGGEDLKDVCSGKTFNTPVNLSAPWEEQHNGYHTT